MRALPLFLCAFACMPAGAPMDPVPDEEGVRTWVLAFERDQTGWTGLRIDESHTHVTFEERGTVFLFGWRCDEPDTLGLFTRGGQLSEAPTRPPTVMYRLRDDGAWNRLAIDVEGLPPTLVQQAGLRHAGPCKTLREIGSDLVPGGKVRLTGVVDGRAVVVSYPPDAPWQADLFDERGLAETITWTSTVPPRALHGTEDGALWIYDMEHRMARTTWDDLRAGRAPERRPSSPNPSAKPCSGAPTSVMVGPPRDVDELLVAGSDGSISRYRPARDEWEVLADEPLDPSVTHCRQDGVVPEPLCCPNRYISAAWLGPGRAIVTPRTFERSEVRMVVDDRVSRERVETPSALVHVAQIDPVGIIASSFGGSVYLRSPTGNWELVSRNLLPSALPVRDFVPIEGGVLFTPGGDRLEQFYPGTGICETPAFGFGRDGFDVRELLATGDQYLAIDTGHMGDVAAAVTLAVKPSCGYLE